MLRLCEVPGPQLPGPRWVRVQPVLSGICGSDVGLITAAGTTFFSPITSFPFTMGHEVVGRVVETGPEVEKFQPGDRVVVEPALHCEVRGISPPCRACAAGHHGNCVNITKGCISPGVQTGFCRDTGGGWSGSLVAHEVQLHHVPEQVTDVEAVLVEPFSCSIHAVLHAAGFSSDASGGEPRRKVLVLGCGSIGLLTLAALRATEAPCHVVAVAKHEHQRELAKKLGAAEVIAPGRKGRDALAQAAAAELHYPEIGGPTVLGGFDVVFDCVGSPRSVDDATRFTAARGRTVLVGMPGFARFVDWTTIWFKETQVIGSYAYGTERFQGREVNTLELALSFLKEKRVDLRPLVTHRFPLTAYRDAIRTALLTGRYRSVKTILDLEAQ